MHARFVTFVALGVLLLGVGCAQAAEYLWFSPLDAVIVPPPAGEDNFIQLTTGSNGASLKISPNLSQAFPKSARWVNIPLSGLPNGMKINQFTLYYQVSSATNNTYIAEEKLAKMTYPNTLTSVYDVTSTLNKHTPAAATFTPKIPITVSGTMNLMLRINLDSLIDSISIGAIKVSLE